MSTDTPAPAPAPAPAENTGPVDDPGITLGDGDKLHVIKDCARIVPAKYRKIPATANVKAGAQGEGEDAINARQFLSRMRLNATLGRAKISHGIGRLVDYGILGPQHLTFYQFDGDNGGLAFGFCAYAGDEKDPVKKKYDKSYMQFLGNDVRLLMCEHPGFKAKMDALAKEDADRASTIWEFLKSEDTRNDGKFLLASQIQKFMTKTSVAKLPTSVIPRAPPSQASLDQAKETRARNRALKNGTAGPGNGTLTVAAGGHQLVAAGGNGLIPAAAWAPGPDGSAPKTAILIGAAYDDHKAMIEFNAIAKKDADMTAMALESKDAKIKSLEKQLSRARGPSRPAQEEEEEDEGDSDDGEPIPPKQPKQPEPSKKATKAKKARKE